MTPRAELEPIDHEILATKIMGSSMRIGDTIDFVCMDTEERFIGHIVFLSPTEAVMEINETFQPFGEYRDGQRVLFTW